MEHLAGFLRPAGALPLKSLELTPPGLSRLPTPAPAEFHACIKAMVAHRRQLNAWWTKPAGTNSTPKSVVTSMSGFADVLPVSPPPAVLSGLPVQDVAPIDAG